MKLSNYKNVFEYVKKFKELHNEIRTIYKKLRLNDVYLIFLFYIELDKEYENYFLYYTQTHDIINAVEKFAFTLKYVIQRFIQIVINSSISRIESILELIVIRSKAYAVTNTTNQTTQRSQPRAIEELDAVYLRRLVKFYQHCQKIYHTHYECNSKNNTQSDNLDRRRRSRSRDRNDYNDHERNNRDRKKRYDRDQDRNDRNKKRKSRNDRDVNLVYYDSEEAHFDENSRIDKCFTAVRRDDSECYASLSENDYIIIAIVDVISKR